MTNIGRHFVARASMTGVRGVVAALAGLSAAYAQDAQLTRPDSEVEVGIGGVSDKSAKFGEYNGLDKQGGYFIGNFRLYGGSSDMGGLRWRVLGSNLGLETRNLQGEVGTPGGFRVTFGYDELVRNYSDTFRTIFGGSGGTALTLPAGYPAAATRVSSTATAAAALANWNNIQAPNATAASVGGGPGFVIPASMQNFDIGTKRTKYDLGYVQTLGESWEFRASMRHELKDGTKMTGVNMNRFSGPNSFVAEPISNSTDQVEASLRYAGQNSHLSVAYSGSFFRNDINTWTVQYPGAASTAVIPNGNVASLVGAPDNQMHQLSLSGGYNFSKATRLVVSGSYARLTQNDSFLGTPAGATWVVPQSSANAKVINSQFLTRLTLRPMRNLGLNVSYKYDERSNRTPVNDYLVTADVTGASSLFTNEPNNRRQQQFNADADYSLGVGQKIKAGYEWQEIRRRGQTYSETPFRAEKTKEDTLRVEYRNLLAERVTGRIGYAYSQRRVSEYEEGDPQPVQPLPSPPAPGADPLLPGFRQFWLADRKRDKLRGALDFQATEAVSLQARLDYNNDRYTNSPYGLKNAEGWVLGFDGTYAENEKLSLSAYYTYEDKKSQLDSLSISRGLASTILDPRVSPAVCAGASYSVATGHLPSDYFTDPCRNWSQNERDQVHTVGLGFKSRGLMANRLELTGNLTYSRARTPISMSGGAYYSNSLTVAGATQNIFVVAQSFPDVTSNMIDLRLSGKYAIDKVSAVRLSYMYRRLSSSNWHYDAYTNSALGVLAVQNYIGPNLTAPNYSVSVLGVSYIFSFR